MLLWPAGQPITPAWLVIINDAGSWVGKILGIGGGSNVAGSAGMIVSTDASGDITAGNSGDGAGSQNLAVASGQSSSTLVQNNQAVVNNNLNLSANSGGNIASQNTGGDTKIKTGDAKIVANIVNFVNNNIVSGGKLIVTVVNVFGNWIGDFVTPGSKKETASDSSTGQPSTPAIGGGTFFSSLPESVVTSSSNSSDSSSDPVPSSTTTGNSDSPLTSRQAPSSNGVILSTSTTGIGGNLQKPSSILASTDTSSNNQTQNAVKMVLTLNLAWLLLLLPILFIFLLTRRIRKTDLLLRV